MSKYDVIDAFKAGRFKASGAFVSNGVTISSYAVVLAVRDETGRVTLTPECHKQYSPTTSGHQNAVKAVFGSEGKGR